ncbi:hypothetical protein PENTCL1PPCAC_23958, partial [Pristionchus entomophagus]
FVAVLGDFGIISCRFSRNLFRASHASHVTASDHDCATTGIGSETDGAVAVVTRRQGRTYFFRILVQSSSASAT